MAAPLWLLAALLVAVSANFYETLGVAPDADEGAVKKAYRRLSLKYHPGASPPRRPAAHAAAQCANAALAALTPLASSVPGAQTRTRATRPR